MTEPRARTAASLTLLLMDTWTCGSCGWSNPNTERTCAKCRTSAPIGSVTRYYSRDKPAEAPAAVRFPYLVQEIRFYAGNQWTSGALCAVAEGLYLVSEKDGALDEVTAGKLKIPAVAVPTLAGKGSLFIPTSSIQAVVKSTTPGYTIKAGAEKVPIRLSGDGRARFAALCAFMGFEA